MLTGQSRTHLRPPGRPQPHLPRPEPDPIPGLWSYRLALLLVGWLHLTLVPVTVAVGLRWVTWTQAEALQTTLMTGMVTVWVLSLIGLILGVVGLSQFGAKARTLVALAVHFTLAVGPLFAALLLRS